MPDVAAVENDHKWVGAANVPLDMRLARRADQRGSIRLPEETKIAVLEVYCDACKRPYDDVIGEPCAANINNEHLRGGPIGVRQRRRGEEEIAAEPIGPFASEHEEPFYAARRQAAGVGAIAY